MILTAEQERAADAVRRFITTDDSEKQTFVLHGLAGTGKTTVLTTIANEYPEARLCALNSPARQRLC